MIISSLPNFLYLKLIGAKVVATISFLQEYAVVCHFSLRHTFREVFQKGIKNVFFACAVGSLWGEYKVFRAIKMAFLYTILIFFIMNQIAHNNVLKWEIWAL